MAAYNTRFFYPGQYGIWIFSKVLAEYEVHVPARGIKPVFLNKLVPHFYSTITTPYFDFVIHAEQSFCMINFRDMGRNHPVLLHQDLHGSYQTCRLRIFPSGKYEVNPELTPSMSTAKRIKSYGRRT